MGLLDKIAPQFALRRARARTQLAIEEIRGEYLKKATKLAYEGAGGGRRSTRWPRQGGSAVQVSRRDLKTLMLRCRHMVENNEVAGAGVEILESEIIGPGIVAQVVPLGKSQRQVDAAKRGQELWDAHFGTKKCDAREELTFYGQQAMAVRSMVEGGAVVIRRRQRRASDGLSLPMQLQMMEPDHIDLNKDDGFDRRGAGRRRNIMGVEFDGLGRRSAYWLYPEHPGDSDAFLDSRRVPASEVIHMREILRVGQVHGIPWIAPVLVRLSEWHDYMDAQLVRQKIAACFAGFEYIHDPSLLQARNSVIGPDAEENDNEASIDSIEPGTMAKIQDGNRVEFSDPPQVEGIQEFARVSLRQIAAGLRIPYEQLAGDLTSVNFSSGRMGRLSFQRSIRRWREKTIIPQLCAPVWDWFIQAATEITGQLDEPVGVNWTPPPPEFIDPRVEVRALTQQIRSGFQNVDTVIRQFGNDPTEFLQRRKALNDQLDALGIVLDSDPRQDQGRQGGPDGGSAEMAVLEAVRLAVFEHPSVKAQLESDPDLALRIETDLDELAGALESAGVG